MKDLGYYNGHIDLIENITVPVNDRVHWFGDGVYDVAMVCGGKPVMLDRHIKRFYTSASMLRIEIPLAPDDLDSLLRDLSSRVDDPDQIVYFQVTRATAPRRHAFPQGATPNLWVTVTPKKLAKPESLRVITIDDTRHLHCNIKTLNLIPNCMAEQFAVDAGCDTAVFHRGEFVTEAVHANAHIIKDGKIVTHPADNLILPGIARERMTEIAKILGIPVEFRPFTLDEFKSADEIFLTSSTTPCARVGEINLSPAGGADPDTFFRLRDAIYADIAGMTGCTF
ncbi:MAG: aminotransferase class IV [Clostridia bacterium]|nr:aminotransferase class IV [Clostridia bacterium]